MEESANATFCAASALYLVSTILLYSVYAHSLLSRAVFRHTPLGAKALAEIEGLRLYMMAAEQHRLNLLNPPGQTPEHFEKLLPYAMALGVSNEWCKKFATVLAAAHYQPTWSDSTFDDRNWGSFNSSFAKPFSDSMRDSMTDKSSSGDSGGSGGGGSSGGGGGGGGGRGW
jgi:uncharacterized membrane protein YgcG